MKNVLWFFLCFSFGFTADSKLPHINVKGNPPIEFSLVSPVRNKISVTGSFGEIRNNHFHAGIDLRSAYGTGGDEILSAANGFIRKISIDDGNYGKSLFIEHPGGFTTMYAHLDHFRADIEAKLKNEQYKNQSNQIEWVLGDNEIPVTAGEHVAYMGNTGASRGAHLHFELRKTNTDEVLDPVAYGIPVEDQFAPVFRRIKCYGFDTEGKLIHEKVYSKAQLTKTYNILNIPGNQLALGVDAMDKSNNSWRWTGIKSIELFFDNQMVYHFVTDSWSLQDAKYINAHIDYPSKMKAHGIFQRCFKLSGNKLPLYKEVSNDGIIPLNDDQAHEVKIQIADASGNMSEMRFGVKKVDAVKVNKENKFEENISFDQDKNITMENCSIHFGEGTFYENIGCSFKEQKNISSNLYSSWYQMVSDPEPVHKAFDISIKPDKIIPEELKSKCFIAVKRGKGFISCGGEWQGEYLHSKFNQISAYAIMVDNVAPSITPISFRANMSKSKSMLFRISDNVPALGEANEIKINAYIDGSWVLLEGDAKSHTVRHTFEDWLSSGPHELLITATDDKANTREFRSTFYR